MSDEPAERRRPTSVQATAPGPTAHESFSNEIVMASRSTPRNRLAKPLPEEWRKFMVAHGVPKRKYTAVCRAELADGRVIDQLIIEEGWIIALDKKGLAGTF